MERVSVEVAADFFQGMVGGHELAAVGEINAIDARVHVRRATDQHVDLFGAGGFELVDARLGGGAANDGVVHDDDAFVADQFGDEIEFDANVEVADELGGLQEAAADVVVADEGHLEGYARLQRIAQGGAVAAVGHGHDHVGGDGEFAGELAAHFDADFIDVAIGDGAVGPREIDVFEDAEGAAVVAGKGLDAIEAVLVDDDDFARLDIADELGVDEVEGAGFAGQDPGGSEPAQAQGAEAVRVAHTDEFLLGHDDERIGALDSADGLNEVIVPAVAAKAFGLQAGLGHEVEDDFAVHGGLEDRTAGFEFLAELSRVGEIAIVGDGNLAAGAVHRERLGVPQERGAGGGVASVADGDLAHQ